MAFECMLGLTMLCLFLTDTSRAEVTHAFSSSGEDVHLPCNNALSDCTSTTWIYSRHSETVELVTLGEIRKHIERLSLGSDCSLNMYKVTKEDYGHYSCRQYVNGKQHGTDTPIFLHVLHVSSSSSQTDIRPGRSLTLSCQLDSYYGLTCDSLVRFEGIELMWVNQVGLDLMTDTRYQMFSSSPCNVSLTTKLLNEDHDRDWRCQLTQRNEVKTSATFIVKYSAPTDTMTDTPVTIPEDKTTVNTQVTLSQPGWTGESAGGGDDDMNLMIEMVVIFTVLVLLIAAAVVLCVSCKKRADKSRGTDVYTEVTDLHGNKSTINISIDPAPNNNEQKDDVTYTEVVTYSKLRTNKVDDKVTYSSIKRETAEAQGNCCQLYASVN